MQRANETNQNTTLGQMLLAVGLALAVIAIAAGVALNALSEYANNPDARFPLAETVIGFLVIVVCFSVIGFVIYDRHGVVANRNNESAAAVKKTRAEGDAILITAKASYRQAQPKALPPPVQPLPNIMAPKSEMRLLQTSENRFVRPEAQPVQGNGANLNGWPRDTEALRIAFALMMDARVPTAKNFAERGLNSGSRYKAIREWLVGAGLACDMGDGNTTPWTSDAYDFGIQANIKKYLSQVAQAPHSPD